MIDTAMTTCNRDTARCADARSYDHALRPCCRAHVIAITRHVTQALTAAGITWWADYGTLLGAVRNPMTTWADYPWLEPAEEPIRPGIVPHDKDADIGLLHQDWSKVQQVLRPVVQLHRYDLRPITSRASMKVRLSAKNHTNLDLFFWHTKPDGTMYRRVYAQVDAYKGKHFHRDMLYPIGSVEWEGMTLSAPCNPEAFLEMRYGQNWRTPVMANHDGVKR